MNKMMITALDHNERFVRRFKLEPKIAYLMLLYYQFSYLMNDKCKQIICSYFESNYQSPHIVIVSHSESKKEYTLTRVRLKEEIYLDLQAEFDDGEETNIIRFFTKLYKKYKEGDN